MERICRFVPNIADIATLSCLHSDCKEKLPFSSVYTLAYHLTVKHNSRSKIDKQIPCILCDFSSHVYTALIEHLKSKHDEYYTEHISARAKMDEVNKRGRKGKQAKVCSLC
ncbi:unnamed protein product [Gongylonema pulchrum]|uniref:C2H2-type domain-containing protein n=1 Tax=Gongylonema pulchrum TaxID=637853 RepID=A0A3P6T8U2_9BILA|nr:unnamed protein product [Gongylonema pulchrum]VDK79729.1 unnamed protein product [Gongylonema pulchrum]